MSYDRLSSEDEHLFDEFCKRIETVWLTSKDEKLLVETTRIRRKYGVKLPDALIAATALTQDATLVTADTDFDKVSDLEVFHLDKS
ncbi:MAG: type II toxin-antitoxin system VapC family toxin [Proteobacteria bacterium]|nr:type II toxin-antitoxin system VapC family toxin [Pseudomonadota bacterium]